MAVLPRVRISGRTSYTPDLVAPTFVNAAIGVLGTTIGIVHSEVVVIGAGGNGGFTIGLSGGACTLTYSSGSNSNTLVYTTSRTIEATETVTDFDYTQPGNGVEDLSGNDLASFSNQHALVTNGSGVAGVESLDDFEGTGIPGGGGGPWSTPFGTWNWDYATSPAPLAGSQSARSNGGTARRTCTTAQDVKYAYTMFHAEGSPSSGTDVLVFFDSADNVLGKVHFLANGDLRVYTGPTSYSAYPGAGYTPGTTRHVWGEYHKGTGSNASVYAYVSTDGIKPASPVGQRTSGTQTAQCAKVGMGAGNTSQIWDNFKISNSPIGNA